MNPEFEIRITEDGSPTIYSKNFDATYHSQKGAMQESMHVFIKNGLLPVMNKFDTIRILEIGFGTGLNAVLTLNHAKNNKVYYHTTEKFPLPETIYGKLNYGNDKLSDLHKADWNIDIEITSQFIFHKTNAGIETIELQKNYNLIYLDAFAPSTQTELWQKDNLEHLYNSLVTGGSLVTFCAMGQFKRDLKSVGFNVESLLGAMGKREMTRATK